MKYDLSQDVTNPATALGKILARVPAGSSVLELGAATGYMTRYMKEQLSCSVSVVELDPQACAQAALYAADSFAGDLQQEAWLEHFSGKQFDCILLSNVLEHVRNPLDILKNAKTLLRPDGKMLIAVPNAAHNDVILNQLKEDWHYTELGLLDRDHVYFYGHKNILDMLNEAGLTAVEEDFVYLATAKTEQQPPCSDLPDGLMEYLRSRRMGEVYQFVIDARPSETAGTAAVNIIENRENTLVSKDEYIAHLETDIPIMKAYIETLETERAGLHADSRAFMEQSGKERAESDEYQRRLEKELTEAQQYITKLQQQSKSERTEAQSYQQKLETELTEAQQYIRELQQQNEGSSAYQQKLETELAEAQQYIRDLQQQNEGSSAYQQKLEAELTEAQQYIRDLQQQNEGSSAYQQKLEAELTEAQQYIRELQQQNEGSSAYQQKLEAELAEARQYIRDLQQQNEGSSAYQQKLETELTEAQQYIRDLQQQNEGSSAYQQKLEAELTETKDSIARMQAQFDQAYAEAGEYQKKLEQDLHEASQCIARMQAQADQNQTSSGEYQKKLEDALSEAQTRIAQLQAAQTCAAVSAHSDAEMEEARGYILKLEGDIVVLNDAVTAFRAEKEEAEQKMKAAAAECSEYKGKCFSQMEKLQQLEMAHKGVCSELAELKEEYEKIMSSPVWKMSKPLRSISESIIGKKEQ